MFDRLDNDVPRNMTYEDVGLATGQQLRLDFTTRTLLRVSDLESFEYKRNFSSFELVGCRRCRTERRQHAGHG